MGWRYKCRPPFGYRLGDQRLVPVSAEAETVRRVYREYLDGRGITRITQGLRADGVRTRRGALLSLSRVGAILSRRLYTGATTDGDEVLCEGAHEAIVDAATFDAVQRLRTTRRESATSPGKPGRPAGPGAPAKRHLLAGLLRCPNGHAMIARSKRNHDFYICGRAHVYGDHFLARHFDEEAERERLLAVGREKPAEATSLAAQADREEASVQDALARIKGDYKRGKIDADTWAELKAELEEEAVASRNRADQLRARAELLSVEVDAADVDTELVSRLAMTMRVADGKMNDEESVAAMRAALGTVFSSVTFSPGLAAWDQNGTYVSGEADLVPVLREDLDLGNKHPEAGGWVWGTRPLRPAPGRTDPVRSRRG